MLWTLRHSRFRGFPLCAPYLISLSGLIYDGRRDQGAGWRSRGMLMRSMMACRRPVKNGTMGRQIWIPEVLGMMVVVKGMITVI